MTRLLVKAAMVRVFWVRFPDSLHIFFYLLTIKIEQDYEDNSKTIFGR